MTVSDKCKGQISEPSVSVLKASAATEKKRAWKYDDILNWDFSGLAMSQNLFHYV
jgi:hypothetical protein